MDRIKIEITRPCLLRGDTLTVGRSTLAVADAAAVIDAGRGQLIDQADAATLKAWREAELKRVLREAGPAPGIAPPPAGWPWQRVAQ